MKQELEVLEKINHPYVVRTLDLCEDESNIYVVLEMLPQGNLAEVLTRITKRGIQMKERDMANLVWQILLAVRYVHEAGLIHRDIKIENIMVEVLPIAEERMSEIICKLSDFGFACVIEPGTNLNLTLGSPLYMAPEVIKGEEYDQKVDIWSLGVIAYFILTGGNFPFDGRSKKLVYANITNPDKKPYYQTF